MNCPKCNKLIDYKGITYHLKVIHTFTTEEMLEELFKVVYEIDCKLKRLRTSLS